MPAPLVLPAPSPPAPTTTQGSTFKHLSATLTGCESPDDYLEPAAVKEDADEQLSEIASTEKFIVFSALCFCFSCCLLLL